MNQNFYSTLYWLTRADDVKNVFDTFSNIFTFLTVIGLILYAISIGYTVTNPKDTEGTAWRRFLGRTYWICQIICIVTWLGYVFVPTKKDCILIVAGGAVGNFITSDSSSRAIPADITKFLHLSLNKEIEDLSAETKQDIKKELGIQTPKDKLIDKVKDLTKEQIIEYLQKDSTVTAK